MKREILETVFPDAKGEYREGQHDNSWSAGLKDHKSGNTWQINMWHGEFWAEKIINNDWVKCNPIPIKAILLLAKYENQPK